MPRPCHRLHPVSPDSCVFCGWMVSDCERGRERRREWLEGEQHVIRRKGGKALKVPHTILRKLLEAKPCSYRGDAVPESSADCTQCGAQGRKAEVFTCSLPGGDGLCTKTFTAKLDGRLLRCCSSCPDRVPPDQMG